ncbi:Bifunctional (p)ppGpp synthase/hydrolase SpoT [Corynebacterium kalinowskii]|uniref:Bifunctional (P)ppGpp synthase/hydrolase SpoT n=1 Tax=Corynebacterium kalinowskii TaxID=2675216 RepID=A0A6B8VS70_9CORY|nr:HD domain-containing protein [Corynebacterium kalinowskii]QGU01855.1 Bifunctional (p)ppGpp synthase/hydrolase SpoT [Corynebacterium kalinowskii]
MFTPRMMRAINAAATAHDGHYRKATRIPYVSHLFGVMTIAASITDDEDVLIACLLHDAIEDIPETYGATQIEADFGPRVLGIVQGVTKIEADSWQERSDAYIAHLRDEASDESLIVSLCDKSHNLMSILADHDAIGDELWERFNSGKERQQWWYRSILEVASQRLPDNEVLRTYAANVERLASL